MCVCACVFVYVGGSICLSVCLSYVLSIFDEFHRVEFQFAESCSLASWC